MERRQNESPPVSEAWDELRNVADHGNKIALFLRAAGNFMSKQVRRQRATFLSSRLAITVLLGFLTIASICWRGRKKVTSLGISTRRLAGFEEDEPSSPEPPPSPELSAICRELGDWSPQELEPGVPRHSSLLVQEFLATIEQEEEEHPVSAPATPPPTALHESYGARRDGGSAPKRPAPSPSDPRDDESPGPSWKLAKYLHPLQQPPASVTAVSKPAAAADMASTHLALTGAFEGPSTSAGAKAPPCGPAAKSLFMRIS